MDAEGSVYFYMDVTTRFTMSNTPWMNYNLCSYNVVSLAMVMLVRMMQLNVRIKIQWSKCCCFFFCACFCSSYNSRILILIIKVGKLIRIMKNFEQLQANIKLQS